MPTVAAQIKDYWMVISTVVGATVAIMSMQTVILVKQATLETTVALTSSALEAFINAGPRYTLKDHIAYADRQVQIDEEQDRRITILEQHVK